MVISAVGLDSGFPKAPAHTHTLSTFSCIVSLPPKRLIKPSCVSQVQNIALLRTVSFLLPVRLNSSFIYLSLYLNTELETESLPLFMERTSRPWVSVQ